MMRARVATILLIGAVAGCGVEPIASNRALTAAVAFTSKTSTLVAGSYSRDGVTVAFSVDASTLSLSDGAGQPLLAYRSNGDDSTTVTFLGGPASIRGWVDASGNDQEVDSGDVATAIAQVMSRGEIRIVPYLSMALGASGGGGNQLPVTLKLHSLASQLAKAVGVDPTGAPEPPPSPMCHPGDLGAAPAADMSQAISSPSPSPSPIFPTAGRSAARLRRPAATANDDCQDISGDPNCDQCLGMCGRGCSCWKWVCGDCCKHDGCLQHDLHCRACDFSHVTDCLLCGVFDFGRPLFVCN